MFKMICTVSLMLLAMNCGEGLKESPQSDGGNDGILSRGDGTLAKKDVEKKGMSMDKGAQDSQVSKIPLIPFAPFPTKTQSITTIEHGTLQLSLTDGSGITACGLSSSVANSLGQAGHQVIMNLGHYPLGAWCMSSIYSIPANCPESPLVDSDFNEKQYSKGCAYYRAWDANGNVIGAAKAISGAIKISEVHSTFGLNYCKIEYQILFKGGTVEGSFGVNGYESSPPWCAQ